MDHTRAPQQHCHDYHKRKKALCHLEEQPGIFTRPYHVTMSDAEEGTIDEMDG